MIAYIRGKGREGKSIVLADVVTRSSITYQGDAREEIMGLSLGHELLVYSTFHGILYVANICRNGDGTDPVRVRLPSSNILALAADDTLTAALLRIDNRTSSVVLYDWGTSSTTTFQFEHQEDADRKNERIPAQALLLNAKENRLEVFGAALTTCDNSEPVQLHYDDDGDISMVRVLVGHMRFSLTGKKLCESDDQWWENISGNLSSGTNPSSSPEIHMGAINPAGRSGLVCFSLSIRTTDETYCGKKSVVFDAVQAKFYQLEALMHPVSFGSQIILWKNCTYMSDTDGYIKSARLYSLLLGDKSPGGRTSSIAPCPQRTVPQRRRLWNNNDAADDDEEEEEEEEEGDGDHDDNADGEEDDHDGSDDPEDRDMVEGEDDIDDFTALVMNDTFLVRFSPIERTVLIMCLDEDVKLKGGIPTGLWVVNSGLKGNDCSEPEQFQCRRLTAPFGHKFLEARGGSYGHVHQEKLRRSMPMFHDRKREESDSKESWMRQHASRSYRYREDFEEDFGIEF